MMNLPEFINAAWNLLGPYVPLWALVIVVTATIESIFAGLVILALS
jgi:hypothetical protein